MSVLGNFMKFEAMRVYAFGSITASYTAIGSATEPSVHQFILTNTTNQGLRFSFDGSTDHIYLASNTSFVSDVNANKSGNHLFLGAGVTLYVKHEGSAPTVGNVYFSTMFGGVRAN
jgi:hypothetical protein